MIRYIYIFLLALVLGSSSCATKTPDFNPRDEGILIIPTEGIIKSDFDNFFYKYRFQYTPGTSYKLHISPKVGKNNMYFVFNEGNYKITGIELAEIHYQRLDFPAGNKFFKLDRPLSFQIESNKITVFDNLLKIIIDNYKGNVQRYQQYINFSKLDKINRDTIVNEIKLIPEYRNMEILDNNSNFN